MSGCYQLEPATRRLTGWLTPAPAPGGDDSDARAVAVICDGQLLTVVLADADPPAGAPAETRGFQWDLPEPLWLGGAEVRVIDLRDGSALDGPAALPGAAPELLGAPVAGAQPVDWGAEPSHWPLGLAGPLAALVNPVTEAVMVLPDPKARHPIFARADGPGTRASSTPMSSPAWAVRATAGNASEWTLLQRLPPAVADLPATAVLKLWARLTRADANLTLAPADVFLSRRDGLRFETLRRLRMARVTRSFSAILLTPQLEEEERTCAADGRLWLGITVPGVSGLEVAPPVPVHDTPAERFEDGRLEATFSACLPRPARAQSGAETPTEHDGAAPLTDIIVPIYNGGETTARCLHALRSATDTPFRVLVVDDGSRAYTTRLLEDIAASDSRFHLHRRATNRGYTKSVNEGLMLSDAPAVVILNSDTVVSDGWLGRLHQALRAVPGAGLAGPLSNAASWQSVPQVKEMDGRWSQNAFIGPADVTAVQNRIAALSRRAYPQFPILNGFCTLFRREVFETCGLLDEDAFPLGYGEETDLCLRALKAGFKAVVADDCFVYHEKSVSFGSATRSELTRQGGFELRNKHLGLNLSVLEDAMRRNGALAELRLQLENLEAELRTPCQG